MPVSFIIDETGETKSVTYFDNDLDMTEDLLIIWGVISPTELIPTITMYSFDQLEDAIKRLQRLELGYKVKELEGTPVWHCMIDEVFAHEGYNKLQYWELN